MTDRIKRWWKLNGLAAAGISKPQWDELDAAIREDERQRVRAETLREVANEIGLASSVPMRSATPGDMAVLLFANRLISRLDALAQPEGK